MESYMYITHGLHGFIVALSLEQPGVSMMCMQSVSGTGLRAIVDFIAETGMYVDFANLHPGIFRF